MVAVVPIVTPLLAGRRNPMVTVVRHPHPAAKTLGQVVHLGIVAGDRGGALIIWLTLR